MKKIIAMVAIMASLAMSATAQKINVASFEARLAKSDAEIADAKKSAKASTWFNRGKLCADAIVAPTKNKIFAGLDANMLNMSVGIEPTEVKDGVYSFEWIDVYSKGGKVIGWVVKKDVLPGVFDKAIEAFAKAYELDPSSGSKIKTTLEELVNFYSEYGSISIDIERYDNSIAAYLKAIEFQKNPAIGKIDPRYYFFIGQFATFLGTKNPQYYADGEKYLNEARKGGYNDEQGNLYYFLFHCYYGQREANRDYLVKAKDTLLEGIEKFPSNERILDGLIQLYTSNDNVGNPADLVGRIDKLLSEKPDNADLWRARGQVFFKLKNYDECINSFLKINELKPNDYDTNFYLGYFHTAKGDEVNRAFNANLDSISGQDEYNARLKEVNAVYMKALPWFERAMELKPESVDCAEYLKQLCFRLRNEEGIMDKYNKYNALYKKLKGIQ